MGEESSSSGKSSGGNPDGQITIEEATKRFVRGVREAARPGPRTAEERIESIRGRVSRLEGEFKPESWLGEVFADGIVIDEEKAKRTPCHCYEYTPGKYICWSEGVIGALTDFQEGLYCNPRVVMPPVKQGIPGRISRFIEVSQICAGLPITERLVCMSKELRKRGEGK